MDHTGGPDVITRILYVGSERLRIKEVVVKMEAEVRERFEEATQLHGKRRKPGMQVTSRRWKLETASKWILP